MSDKNHMKQQPAVEANEQENEINFSGFSFSQIKRKCILELMKFYNRGIYVIHLMSRSLTKLFFLWLPCRCAYGAAGCATSIL